MGACIIVAACVSADSACSSVLTPKYQATSSIQSVTGAERLLTGRPSPSEDMRSATSSENDTQIRARRSD